MAESRHGVSVHFEDRPCAEAVRARAEAAALAAIEAECGGLLCSLDIEITGDEGIAALNAEHRGIPGPTDVLSFPMLTLRPGEPFRPEAGDSDEDGRLFLGDIVISYARVLAQAAEYGHSPERELAYLTVHGCLHLFGYDHETEADRALMRAREELLTERLGLPRGTGEDE